MSLRQRGFVLTTAVVMLVGLTAGTALALQTCVVVDTETEEVLAGVILTWDSSFLCANAPDGDTYQFTVTVSNAGGSRESVTIESLELTQTTPRPGGSGPEATGTVSGLPQSLAPGESGSFTVSGAYQLVETDEGKKANLHFQAHGAGDTSNDAFGLGINAQFRASDATEEGDGTGPASEPLVEDPGQASAGPAVTPGKAAPEGLGVLLRAGRLPFDWPVNLGLRVR